MTRVLTIGTFDTPHLGHAILFKRCAELGDVIIGINTDEFVQSYKNKTPLYSYEERARLIAQMGHTVVPNDSAGRELINVIQPDIIVIGSDWATRDYLAQIDVNQDYLDENDISVMYVPYTKNISTTSIKERVVNEYTRPIK